MITSISENGIHRKLVINESVILADKKDKVCFSIENNGDKFQLIFGFSDTGKEFATTLNPSENPSIYDITLHKWYGSTSFVETTKAWELTRKKSNYWIHWRTFAHEKATQRVFEISIWTNQN